MREEKEKNHEQHLLLEMENLKVICALGRGAEGVVFLIQTDDGRLLALKAVLRSSCEGKKKKVLMSSTVDEHRRVFFDTEVLASFDHPLLPKLYGVLVTDKVVGYAMDYCSGGDLNSLRKHQTEKLFSEDSIRFYAAELVLALEYLHNLGIVHRDLKPENVMVQENGHLMLVDFDLSTKLSSKPPDFHPVTQSKPEIKPRKRKKFGFLFKRRDSGISPEDSSRGKWTTSSESDSVAKSNSFVGTEEYLAPEIILGDGHDFAVDWWCLGIVLYEMLYGTTPFRGANKREIFNRILRKQPDLTGNETPLRDLIGKLLEKDPMKRINVCGIKRHEFFEAVDWCSITEMPRPPFIPELTDVEGMMGNNEINVETFAHEVFTQK